MQQLTRRTHANRRETAADLKGMVTPPVPGRFSVSEPLPTPSPPAIPSHEKCGAGWERPRSPQVRLELSNLSCNSSR